MAFKERLTKGTTDWSREQYVNAFASAFKLIQQKGLKVKILVHDYFGEDEKVASEIASAISSNEPESLIYQNPAPKQLKAAISSALFIVGSRFHGLVAALSNSVPAIAIGWGHKYGELLHDFGLEDFDVVSATETDRLLHDLLPQMLNESRRIELSSRVSSKIERNQRADVEECCFEIDVGDARD